MNLAKEFGHDFDNGNFFLVDKNNMLVYTEYPDGNFIKKKYFDNGRVKYVLHQKTGSYTEIFFDKRGNIIYIKSN